MRKGQESIYDKWNISVLLVHVDWNFIQCYALIRLVCIDRFFIQCNILISSFVRLDNGSLYSVTTVA